MEENEAKAIGDEVAKEKRKRRSRPEQFAQTEPGDNTKYLMAALERWDLPKVNFKSPEEVYDRTVWYFKQCATRDMKPTITGYANALGVSRITLFDYCVGINKCPEDTINTLKKAKSIIEEQMENYMANGKINPVSGIFLLKNNFQNYQDKQEVEVKAISVGAEADRDAIAAEYIEAIPHEALPTDSNTEQ